jgi:protein O-GlcNAc transferase
VIETEQEIHHFYLGTLRYALNEYAQAATHFEHALSIRPEWSEAWSHYGSCLMKSHRYRKALDSLRNAIAFDKQAGKSHIVELNIGVCLENLGRMTEALASYRRAVTLNPDYAMGWFNLAGVLRRHGVMQEVANCYLKAVRLNPDWDIAHLNLAVAYRKLERMDKAIHFCRKAIEVNPDFSEAHVYLLQLAQHTCDWQLVTEKTPRINQMTRQALSRKEKTAESPMLNIRRFADPAMNFEVARSWSRRISVETSGRNDFPRFRHLPRPASKLRIGYLSSDFKDHAVAHQIRGMLAAHDRTAFEIFGYANNPDDGSAYRRFLSQACDQFTDIHAVSDIQAARKIFEDRIHILVDLSGHSRGGRQKIAAMHPAPIQVNYLGFLGTSGADFFDYTLADDIVIPAHHLQYYSEKIVYLPHCYQANDDRLPIAPRDFQRSELGLPEKGTVFCSFNQPYKIDAQLFDAWMHILKQTADSVLWLIEQNKLARLNLCRAAHRAKVDPSRLVFAGALSIDLHLARLKLADLALDTRTYNGGATTSNALWAGVPILTILGNHWVSRMSASALHAVGLTELVTHSIDEYQEMAVYLASFPDRLLALRQKLAQQRRKWPLFDTQAFTRDLENAYRTMWQRHKEGLQPISFSVRPRGLQ